MDAQFSIASFPPFPLQSFEDHAGSYEQLICTSNTTDSPWTLNQPRPSSHNSNPNVSASFNSLFFPPEPLRFLGDGLDLRRPIMSTPQQNVIDLTEDSSPVNHRVHLDPDVRAVSSTRATRPPRFPRDIIDLEEQENTSSTAAVRGGSPEIEFVSSRPLPPTIRNRSPSIGRQHGRRNADPGQNLRPPESNHSRPTGAWWELRNQVSRVQQSLQHPPRMHHLNALLRRDMPTQTPPRNQFSDTESDTIFVNTGHDTILPGQLDFSTQGFLMGDVPRPPPPPPTYDAPSPPRPDFTRSPREDDVVVCPNCEEELGIGEDESKRQVWVIKSCGHVYCGECTRNRFKNKSKAKSKTKHFSRCVVDGCGNKSITNVKSLFQIYL